MGIAAVDTGPCGACAVVARSAPQRAERQARGRDREGRSFHSDSPLRDDRGARRPNVPRATTPQVKRAPAPGLLPRPTEQPHNVSEQGASAAAPPSPPKRGWVPVRTTAPASRDPQPSLKPKRGSGSHEVAAISPASVLLIPDEG